jgi:hypothetical protein
VARKENELRLEQLLGRHVRDASGRVVGRLEEFRASREGEHWVVTEFDIGPTALLERLAVRHLGVTWFGRVHGYRATWDQLNLEDSDRPTLTCGVDELRKLR